MRYILISTYIDEEGKRKRDIVSYYDKKARRLIIHANVISYYYFSCLLENCFLGLIVYCIGTKPIHTGSIDEMNHFTFLTASVPTVLNVGTLWGKLHTSKNFKIW